MDMYCFLVPMGVIRVMLLVSFLSLAACVWEAQKDPSVIVLAVESFNARRFACDGINGEEDRARDAGFSQLCKESIRFTHAYTPSLMSQASMASILMGRYPFELNI